MISSQYGTCARAPVREGTIDIRCRNRFHRQCRDLVDLMKKHELLSSSSEVGCDACRGGSVGAGAPQHWALASPSQCHLAMVSMKDSKISMGSQELSILLVESEYDNRFPNHILLPMQCLCTRRTASVCSTLYICIYVATSLYLSTSV